MFLHVDVNKSNHLSFIHALKLLLFLGMNLFVINSREKHIIKFLRE